MTNEHLNEAFFPKVPELNLEEHADMLTEFTGEVLDLLIEAKNAILALEAIPNDKESLSKAFKIFYMIKGLAAFLNLTDIQCLAKESEELFDSLRKETISIDDEVIEVALEAVDHLRILLDLLNEQISNQGHLTSSYCDISTTLERILLLKERAIPGAIKRVIIDKRSGKKPTISLPVFDGDSRSKMLKRQQELIKERELAIKIGQQAQKLASEKSDMLASMSHEMRTLINAILGFSELLIKSPLEEKQKIFLNSIRSSGELLLDIINNILDLAKIERGKLKLEQLSFSLPSVVEDVFQIIRARLEGKGVSLFFVIDPNIPHGIKGDPTRFRQILLNLLGNAVKFTDKGEVGLFVDKISSQETTEDGDVIHLRFKILDTGIGIPESRVHYIFEPFMQGDKSIAREYGGTGLGLAISKSYIEIMGGKIWVESQAGKGSQFIFEVPFPVDAVLTKKVSKELSKKLTFAKEKSVVLIDRDSRQELLKHCQAQEMDVKLFDQSVKDIEEILICARPDGKAPDLICIDLLGYKDEAYLLASKLQQEKAFEHTKIVAITSDIKIGVSSEAYKACFDDYLLRPIIQHEFFSFLKKTFGYLDKEDKGLGDGSLADSNCSGIDVLIVDDSATNIELIKAYFESIECRGDFATNGHEAIEMIKKKRYDICFMDLQMPVMNGFAAAQIIRQDISRGLPIVALTAADAEEDKEKCKEIGFDDFLSKPFNMDDFKNKIITYGRKHQ
jgi:signal transduction histidine kinase/CheY-like chemotaxis protein